jgi:hypothetical protein
LIAKRAVNREVKFTPAVKFTLEVNCEVFKES